MCKIKIRIGGYYLMTNGTIRQCRDVIFGVANAQRIVWMDSPLTTVDYDNEGASIHSGSSIMKEVLVSDVPKPVTGTVAIIKDLRGRYRAERGRLSTTGAQLDANAVADGVIVARLTWTEGEGL